ncbi:MAG: hypothetical protein Q4F53_09605 [Nesterenkonia sp.]|uniref:hypothetical protein n=1 Tax=Nesterenkonia marinintestina TaxID=2979865 RepID=UPI0021BE0640|nr:hypothetical protein [Nesterenkonia sp. GX14115]MDO5493847.1 hypothetical protein [Nesterenkonia sp.]
MKPVTTASRRIAAATIAAAAVVGMSGCSAANYMATTHSYSASDGVKTDVEQVKFRHMALVTDAEGNPARVIGSVDNGGTEDAQVTIEVDGDSFEFDVPPGEEVSLEHDEEFVVESLEAAPGAFHEITVDVDDSAQELRVSVLDGVLEEYRELIPEGYDDSTTDHLEHGPDTWGSGAAHHEDDH